MNHDWVTAEAVQKNLLPRHQLTFGDLECETYYRPFHIIGGDYYDFVPFDRGKVGIAIGDVSGKGIGAALMMANLQASLRARLLNQDTRPPAVVESVNHLLYESSLPHIYATLFYGEYDVEERVLTYVNAGHNPPLILRQEGDRARLIRLESEGPPIGMFRDTIYEGRSCLLQPGDVFIAYTDGVTESSNPMQQFWGLERLEARLSKCIGKVPADIIEAVLTARDEFAGPIAPADDMTLVVASIDGRAASQYGTEAKEHAAMIFERFEVPGLSQYSYAVGVGGSVAIIDPKRDVDTYLGLRPSRDLRIKYVLETHIHADFASGARALASHTGAELCVSGYTGGEVFSYRFVHRLLREGDELPLGELTLEVLHTPGHTPEHISFLLSAPSKSQAPIALFSGDFLFVGSLGRPDLLGEGQKERLARDLYKSVRRICKLPDGIEIYPGHGAGSLCGAGMSERKQSTLGYERASNPFFRDQPEAEFVEAILDPVLELPGYYGRMKKINSDGPPVLRDTPNLERLAPSALEKKKQESEAIIVDLRRPEAFGGAHIPGSFNIGAGPNLAMWAAWVLPPDTPILLVGDEQTNLDEAYSSFLRVALDRVTGSLQGGIQSWIEKGNDQAHIPQVSVRELKQFLDSRNSAMVLDVRSPVEWESGHIPGAIHIPAGELQMRLNEVDTAAPLYVICGSGYRSSIAASILTRTRRLTPINVNGGMAA